MQKVRRHPFPSLGIGLRPLVSVRFQVLFTRLVAVLFIVRSPYSFTIGHRGVFSLGRWAGPLRAGFHEPRATLVRLSTPSLGRCLRGCHPLWPAVPGRSTELSSARGARNPGPKTGLGCSVFARRYWRNRCLFLFLRLLRCFSSPRSLYRPYAFGPESPKRWGFPIRKSSDRLLFARSPTLIAGCRVLRRLSMPRHPPYTLKSLTTVTDHRHRQGVAVTRTAPNPRPRGQETGRPIDTGSSFAEKGARRRAPRPGSPLRAGQTERHLCAPDRGNGRRQWGGVAEVYLLN